MVLISVYFMYSFNLQPLSFTFKKFSYQQLSSIKTLVPLTVLVFAQWNNSSCNLSERNWTTTHSGLPKKVKKTKEEQKKRFSKLDVLYSKAENCNVSPIYQKACIFFTQGLSQMCLSTGSQTLISFYFCYCYSSTSKYLPFPDS